MIKQGKLYNSDLQIKYNLNSRERFPDMMKNKTTSVSINAHPGR